MIDLALVTEADAENPDVGDLRLVDGQLATVEGREAYAQDANVCLRWFRGEWFQDLRAGLPWFQLVIGVETSDQIVASLLRRALRQRPGVAEIVALPVAIEASVRLVSIGPIVLRTADGDLVEMPAFVLGDLIAEGV